MSHYKEVCEFGFTHSSCRCMGPHTIRLVECIYADKHGKKYNAALASEAVLDVAEPDVVESTHERVQAVLYEYVEKRFWYHLPGVQRDIVNDIEAALIKARVLAS